MKSFSEQRTSPKPSSSPHGSAECSACCAVLLMQMPSPVFVCLGAAPGSPAAGRFSFRSAGVSILRVQSRAPHRHQSSLSILNFTVRPGSVASLSANSTFESSSSSGMFRTKRLRDALPGIQNPLRNSRTSKLKALSEIMCSYSASRFWIQHSMCIHYRWCKR